MIGSIMRVKQKLKKTKLGHKLRYYMYYEPRNKELKDIHYGKRAFIIGNGPSILKQDLKSLNGEITFVMNSFFHHPNFHDINPTYLCNCDSTLIDPNYRNAWWQLHQQVDTTKTTMLFSHASKKVDRELNLFKEHNVYYLLLYNGIFPPLSSMDICPTDLTRSLSSHGLVFIDVALFSAFYMGIQNIYLIGFDAGPVLSLHDYVNYNFYGKDPLFTMDKYKSNYEKFFVQKEFQKSRKGLYSKSIDCIKRTFKKRGVKIQNATHDGGNLQGFPHVNYEKLMAK
jgi:hypothetical protein